MPKKSSKKKAVKVKKKKAAVKRGYKQGEVYVPVYDIWISGNKLPLARKQCITSVSCTETVSGSDSATISICDTEFDFVNDDIFSEDRRVKIRMGFSGFSYRYTFEGYISNVDISFGEEGYPTLDITCMDNTYRMNKKQVSKKYKKTTSAKVVKKICKKYGFKCVVQSGYKFQKQKEISQSKETDIAFIQKLAGNEIHPFTARLVGKTFYYVKMGKLESSPSHSLTYDDYPSDIMSFSPRINTETREESSGSTDKKKKKRSKASASSSKGTEKTSKKKASTGKKKDGRSYNYNPKDRKWSSSK